MQSIAKTCSSGRRAAIADRYDTRGYYRVGNGAKTLVTFDESKDRYLNRWTPPRAFSFSDMTYEILSKETAVVVGLAEWQAATGEKAGLSYSALLVKGRDGWRIRVEDESFSPVDYVTKPVSGDRNKTGPVNYILTAQPGASIAAHRHSQAMQIKVVSGRKLILMGDLENAKVQIFDAGSTFTIPANVWHLEWWETETVEDITILAPWKTERATPATPRSK